MGEVRPKERDIRLRRPLTASLDLGRAGQAEHTRRAGDGRSRPGTSLDMHETDPHHHPAPHQAPLESPHPDQPGGTAKTRGRDEPTCGDAPCPSRRSPCWYGVPGLLEPPVPARPGKKPPGTPPPGPNDPAQKRAIEALIFQTANRDLLLDFLSPTETTEIHQNQTNHGFSFYCRSRCSCIGGLAPVPTVP